MGTLKVDALGVGLNDIGGHVGRDVKDALVVLNGVLIVDRRVIELVLVGIAALLQFNNPLHKRVVEIVFDFIYFYHCYFVFCL